MDIPSIAGGIAVLGVSFVAYIRASAALREAEDAKREAQRRASGVEDDLRKEIETLKATVVRMASGEEITPDMVEEGRLWHDIDAAPALELVKDRGARILDVRTHQETAGGVVEGAILIPMDEIEARKDELPRDDTPLLVYCAAGVRSAAVCEYLSQDGFSSLFNLTGGFGSWQGATDRPS